MNRLENVLGNRIRKTRIKLGLTQSDLALVSGIGRKTIGEIESGITKKPKIETLLKLTEVLPIEVDDILDMANYDDKEIDEFYGYEGQVHFDIRIHGILKQFGKNKENIMDKVSNKVLQAFYSVDGKSPLYDELRCNADTTIDLEYIED